MIDVCKKIYVGLVQSIINHGTVGELNIIACFGLNSHYFDEKKGYPRIPDLQAPRTSFLIRPFIPCALVATSSICPSVS